LAFRIVYISDVEKIDCLIGVGNGSNQIFICFIRAGGLSPSFHFGIVSKRFRAYTILLFGWRRSVFCFAYLLGNNLGCFRPVLRITATCKKDEATQETDYASNDDKVFMHD